MSRRVAGRQPSETLRRIVTSLRLRKGETLYLQDEHADCWYRMVAGAAREYELTAQGTRRCIGFFLPGDTFGFNSGVSRALAAEMLMDSTLERYPRSIAESLARSDPDLRNHLRSLPLATEARAESRRLALDRLAAREKLAAFLLQIASRAGRNARLDFELPMSRTDIAEYLDIAPETVSRSIRGLCREEIIALERQKLVRVLDLERLTALGTTTLQAPTPFVAIRLAPLYVTIH